MKALLFISMLALAGIVSLSWSAAAHADDDAASAPMTAMWGSNIKDTSAEDEARIKKEQDAQDAADRAAAAKSSSSSDSSQ
jgi:hypothetical protein